MGSQINYFGIDPLESEIKKLVMENRQNSKYISGFVIAPGASFRADEGTQYFFNRSSAFYDQNNGFDIVKENFNSGQNVVYSENRYSVDELIRESGFDSLDLLKIDVDGDDYPLLLSFSKNSASNSILTLDIESQFHGDDGEFGNTFANISVKAKELGLHLFDIETFRYSRSALPAPYVHNFPAQTISGQVLWADSVFMRDSYELKETRSLIKLAALYDVYGLPDCSFELLKYHEEKLMSLIPITEVLHELSNAEAKGQHQNLGVFRRISKKIMK